MQPLRVVLGEKYISNGNFYDGWYVSETTGEPTIYFVYGDATRAKVLTMVGFEILWGDNPPPDSIKEKLMKDYQPVPVKVVPLA